MVKAYAFHGLEQLERIRKRQSQHREIQKSRPTQGDRTLVAFLRDMYIGTARA